MRPRVVGCAPAVIINAKRRCASRKWAAREPAPFRLAAVAPAPGAPQRRLPWGWLRWKYCIAGRVPRALLRRAGRDRRQHSNLRCDRRAWVDLRLPRASPFMRALSGWSGFATTIIPLATSLPFRQVAPIGSPFAAGWKRLAGPVAQGLAHDEFKLRPFSHGNSSVNKVTHCRQEHRIRVNVRAPERPLGAECVETAMQAPMQAAERVFVSASARAAI
jgi:hypothetical protein